MASPAPWPVTDGGRGVRLRRLALTDFRSYPSIELDLPPGLTVVVGPNGQGKTNLVEAVAYAATLESFRGAPPEALVRDGAERAIVRVQLDGPAGRSVDIDCELPRRGRTRTLVNRQRLTRAADLIEVFRVSVFSPDDLVLVKEGPAGRRRFLDDAAVGLDPHLDRVRREVERVVRQRTTLLKQAGGRLTPDTEVTLDVWDAKLAQSGDLLGRARHDLVRVLAPLVAEAYADLAGRVDRVGLHYLAPWRDEGLAAALSRSRADDLRRQVTQVGPHRDDLELRLHGRPARTHASQGEQRCLALALRLAVHRLLTDRAGWAPVLLLDDVFSELDEARRAALVRSLPAGQVLLTTAGDPPELVVPEQVLRAEGGCLHPTG